MRILKTFSRLNEIEVEPSPEVWDKVSHRLDKLAARKKKRRFLFFFLLAGSLVSGTYLILSNTEKKTELVYTDPQTETARRAIDTFTSAVSNARSAEASTGNMIISSPGTDENISVSSTESTQDVTSEISQPVFNFPITSERKKRKTSSVVTRSEDTVLTQDEMHDNRNSSGIMASLSPLSKVTTNTSLFEIYGIDQILERSITPTPKRSLSRWQIFAGVSYSKSFFSYAYGNEGRKYEGKGGSSIALTGMLAYDLSSRFTIASGIRHHHAIHLTDYLEVRLREGTPATPDENVYALNTPSGELTGIATGFDEAYFKDKGSTLFSPSLISTPAQYDTITYVAADIRERFTFLTVPLHIYYRINGPKVSFYLGGGAAVSFLNKSEFFVNDNHLNYSYSEKLNTVLTSAELTGKISWHVFNNWSIYAGPAFSIGLNSLNKHDVLKPSSFFMSGGLAYRFSHKNTKPF